AVGVGAGESFNTATDLDQRQRSAGACAVAQGAAERARLVVITNRQHRVAARDGVVNEAGRTCAGCGKAVDGLIEAVEVPFNCSSAETDKLDVTEAKPVGNDIVSTINNHVGASVIARRHYRGPGVVVAWIVDVRTAVNNVLRTEGNAERASDRTVQCSATAKDSVTDQGDRASPIATAGGAQRLSRGACAGDEQGVRNLASRAAREDIATGQAEDRAGAEGIRVGRADFRAGFLVAALQHIRTTGEGVVTAQLHRACAILD